MDTFVAKLQKAHPDLQFIAGDAACWGAETNTVTYVADSRQTSLWGVLHELGHALLGHTNYQNDIDLLKKEVAAWERAQEVAPKYGLKIDREYIENCLDTYRDWLARRSSCPQCSMSGLQENSRVYRCFNCLSSWNVSGERQHRPYRKQKSPVA